LRKNPAPPALPPIDNWRLRQLAAFRYQLRRFLRFSEGAARARGLTPLQHQLLLGIAGFTGRGWATITELSEFLQARHNAVVGLVQRAESRGLVRKQHGSSDQRFVRVYLLPKGQRILDKLSQLHQKEVQRFEHGFLNLAAAGHRPPGRTKGKTGLPGQDPAGNSPPGKQS
jgi:DNA-binding MarR family transcriptional regulator